MGKHERGELLGGKRYHKGMRAYQSGQGTLLGDAGSGNGETRQDRGNKEMETRDK